MTDKVRIDQLAVFGAPRAFSEALHVGRPNIGNRERLLERIGNILDGGWLTNNGPFVQEFEQQLAALAGVQHCVAVCNATIALEITIRALGLAGEVIVPSFTFVASAHALQSQGITPVFCDIDPQTHNLDPHKIEAALTPRTTGILGVHLWGRASDVAALTEIAARRRLTLLFDAAHALGCSAGGRMIGNFGSAEVFSFHATKFLNTSEGGAVMTNDCELAAKIRLMRNFGFTGYDRVASIGTNGKMSEIAAAMGVTSLECLDEFIAVNLRNYQQYREELASLPGVQLLPYDENEKCNYQYIVLEIDAGLTQLTRDELVRVLWAENVIARRYFYPGCHRMEPYRSLYPQAGSSLAVTEQLAERVLVLPTGTAVGPEQVATICQVIKTAVSHGAAIHQQLSKDVHQAGLPRELRDQADAQLEPMGLQSKFRRLMNLYKPSRVDDRVTALSSEAAAEAAALRDELAALRAKHTELELKLELKVASLARREEVDLFKSSLEVPFEWIAEFQEWKARHPIPEQPLVTVCVATFNRGRLLTERCIPSILGQTYRNLELIVVGDGCTDETEELISGIRDPRLKFVNLPERGHYPADPLRRWMVAGTVPVNHAMSLARGDYVTHLDDDDEHLPDRLEKLVAFARAEQCDLVWHPFWFESAAGEWLLNDSQEFAWTQVTTSAVFYRAWLTRIEWDVRAYRLMEPGDWNRFRRIKYLGAVCRRYPEPLLRHYQERNRKPES